MNKEEIRKIFEQRKGKITETNTEIKIENNNVIRNYYTDGKVANEKRVVCVIGVEIDKNRLYGNEKTYSIIGGFSGGRIDETNLNEQLDRYGFEKQEVQNQQLSFMELLGL